MSRRPTKKVKPIEEPVPVSAPASWHRKLAKVTGEISLVVVRRSITKAQIASWGAILDEVKGEMDAFIDRPR
jgi:hypothetical protein